MSDWQSTNEARLAAPSNATSVRLTGELDRLRRNYNSVLLERNAAWSQLANAEQIIRDAHERAAEARAERDEARRDRDQYARTASDQLKLRLAAEAENERLTTAHPGPPTTRASNRARAYQLTDKGLAATEPWTGDQTDTDAAKLIGEAIQAGSDG